MAVKKKVVHLKKVNTLSIKSKPKTVYDLKRKYQQLPLNYLFGIEDEIDFQCPILDDYLEKLEVVQKKLEKIRRGKNIDTAQVDALAALFQLADLEKGIDEITRMNFEKMRDYAKAWKELAILAINETKNPELFLKV
ncbi:MAG: hypothetical protein P8Q41_13755 [Saprospiraceae bacterium]|nr:hypothetical protein [Saprospiraceae bacterium]